MQVTEVLRKTHMIQFSQLCSLLGMSGGKVGSVLDAVLGCCVLVQGCWVVNSHVIYPDAADAAKRNARDYIVRKCVWFVHSLLQNMLFPELVTEYLFKAGLFMLSINPQFSYHCLA